MAIKGVSIFVRIDELNRIFHISIETAEVRWLVSDCLKTFYKFLEFLYKSFSSHSFFNDYILSF